MKKIVLLIIGIMISVVAAYGYVNINRCFPESKVIKVPVGEAAELQEGVWVSVEKSELLTEKESQEIYKNLNDRSSMTRRILKVQLIIENRTLEKKRLEFPIFIWKAKVW